MIHDYTRVHNECGSENCLPQFYLSLRKGNAILLNIKCYWSTFCSRFLYFMFFYIVIIIFVSLLS